MIQAIPNQPINFLPSSLFVSCPDKRLALIVGDEDTIRFQFALYAPGSDAYGYGAELRNWKAVESWAGTGAWVSTVDLWLCSFVPSAGGYVEPFIDTFAPVLGTVYQVIVDLPSIEGTATFSMGGQSFTLSAPGESIFTINAASTVGPRITLDDAGSRICIDRIRIYEVIGGDEDCIITVQAIDATTDEVLEEINSTDFPEAFDLLGSNMAVTMQVTGLPDIIGHCIYLKLSSSCDGPDEFLCSQPMKVADDCKDTMVVRGCLDYDALGFSAPAIFEVRVRASLVRPRWDFDSSEERWSDGTINRYFIDRQKVMDFMVQPVDETLHPFLAALCMFDHVYINSVKYSVDADGYEPAYGDGASGTAAALMTVRPKQELMRKVVCGPPGPGCDPADDPPCILPNAVVDYYFSSADGGWMVTVVVYSSLGFLPNRINIYADDVEVFTQTWTAPASFLFGPIATAEVIKVEITNRSAPECDWSTEFALPTCATPGRISLTIGSGAGDIWISDTTEGNFSVQLNDGSPSVYTATDFVSLSEGIWCIWPSDSTGTQTGVFFGDILIVADVTEWNIGGIEDMGFNSFTAASTSLINVSIPHIKCSVFNMQDGFLLESLNISLIDALANLNTTNCAVLTTVILPTSHLLSLLDMSGCALSESTVDAILASLVASGITGGSVDMSGGTSSPPSVTGAADAALLASSSNLTVAGSGSASANGSDYVLTTPLNGRDRYTHTGAFIFWNGTNWRIQTGGGDIYEGVEDVMQPWLVTTWNAIGATPLPIPTVTGPGLGWIVLTN